MKYYIVNIGYGNWVYYINENLKVVEFNAFESDRITGLIPDHLFAWTQFSINVKYK